MIHGPARAILWGLLVLYIVCLLYLILWRIDLALARREAQQARERHDVDEQARLKGIREGTWQ